MAERMVKAVVFDLDGTLIDSAPAIAAIGDRMMRELGLAPLPAEEGRRYIGNGAPKFVERALAARGVAITPDGLAAHVARFETLYAAAPGEDNPPFPNAEAALRALRDQGLKLGLCTNKPEAPTRNVIAALGWAALFEVVVSGDTLPVKKPDPAPLRHAAAALGAEIAGVQSLYVGDSEVDADTAEAAGAPFLLHAEGYRRSPIETIRHDRSFADFAELPALVRSFAEAG